MSTVLEAVRLNHPQAVASITLRRNALLPVAVPEWQRGRDREYADAPAAYSIADARSRVLTVQARLSSDVPARRLEVRAVALAEPAVPDWWQQLQVASAATWPALYDALLARSNGRRAQHVLGSSAPVMVDFDAGGDSGWRTFELPAARVAEASVGINDIAWLWQFREPNGTWRSLAETRHRIYVLLDRPTEPWVHDAEPLTETQLVWTEVLDFACTWAAGATNVHEAAAAMTARVYALGAGLVQYGCPILALSQYSWPFFDCTAWLELLRGGLGNGPYVNCSDCATVTSSFANALGCDLWQSKMGNFAPFALNPILAIGSGTWQVACGWGAFNYHEVAWTGACSAADSVYDSCLCVSGTSFPDLPPSFPLLPVAMRFGWLGEDGYRYRLAAPLGRVNCEPQPHTRQRRFVV